MIKRKLKKCKTCGKDKYLFSHGNCLECYKLSKVKDVKPKPKKPIAKFSQKHLERLKEYRIVRDKYLKENPICKRCGSKRNLTLHHIQDRLGDNLTDVNNFMTLCLPCHQWVSDETNEAIKQGFAKSRLKK